MSIDDVLVGKLVWHVEHGDSLDVMPLLPDACLDVVVTDPPYGLSGTAPDMVDVLQHWLSGDDAKVNAGSVGFMGRSWDSFVPGPATWKEHFRLLKPGGHMFVFGGTRTYDLLTLAIRLAGFEIRECIQWVFGSGFPKSLDVSKAIARRSGGDLEARKAIEFMRGRREALGISRIDFECRIFGRSDGNVRNWEDGISLPKPGLWPSIKKAMELESTSFDSVMERGDAEVAREDGSFGYQGNGERWEKERTLRVPETDLAKQWEGWGTALKPCYEPILVARKPLIGTVAANILTHGTGGLNIAACRVSFASKADETESKKKNQHADFGSDAVRNVNAYGDGGTERPNYDAPGRWPSNILFQHSASCVLAEHGRECDASCPVAELDRQSGTLHPRGNRGQSSGGGGMYGHRPLATEHHAREELRATGGASRFFNTFEVDPDDINTARFIYQAKASKSDRNAGCSGITNTHPTVKPTAILRHLVKLGCPPGGVVGDFFNGSGSTGRAAVLEGFRYVGCELNDTEAEPYVTIARRRIASAAASVSAPTPSTQPATPPKQGGLFDD